MLQWNGAPVIAAARTDEEFQQACASQPAILFLLNADIQTLRQRTEQAHASGKKLFIHIDFAEGIGKDKSGLRFMQQAGVDGIISTRANIIRLAKECRLTTIQRFFIIDSHSVSTAVESIKSAKPDMIEIMPGIIPREISSFVQKVPMPVIAGGLIESREDILAALRAGAAAVSTAKQALWDYKYED